MRLIRNSANSTSSRLLSTILFGLVCANLLAACGKETPRFVNVPESASIADHATGHLLINRGWDSAAPARPGIISIAFPSLTISNVLPSATDYLDIHAIGGPDRNGNIAFLRSSQVMQAPWFEVGLVHIGSGKTKVLFRRSGKIFSEGGIGRGIALSPTGAKIAFIDDLHFEQHPGAYLGAGVIHIWDVAKSTAISTGIRALQGQLWWFPDGKEVVFVRLLSRNEIPDGINLPGSPYGREYEEKYGSWSDYPVTSVLNIETGEAHLLSAGMSPILSPDGGQLLLKNGGHWVMIDMNSHRSVPFNYPTWWSPPKLLLNSGLAIFEAPPAVGTEPRWISHGSFKAGAYMNALKIGDISGWQFETIAPYFDPREEVSYGTYEGTDDTAQTPH